ncbi:MAG: hypothetical protein KAJ19_03960 [Gammaproteobacteria bacterium]|nr:hypothetical protein [Gammaproteobacteria bacterium]
MKQFTCVKPTTFKGRQVIVGAGITVDDKTAETFKDNKCWKPLKSEKAPVIKKPAAKTTKPVTGQPAAPAKAATPVKPEEVEAQRQQLIVTAGKLGLKPRANTGITKLEEMIRTAKKVTPDETQSTPASVI